MDLEALLQRVMRIDTRFPTKLDVIGDVQAWLNQKAKVKLRDGHVRDLFGEWLKPRRAFRLLNAGEMGVNPDQRIHEDARRLTELSSDLCIGLVQSSLLLGSFIDVLWILSGNVTFHLSGRGFAIPGYMVWCALLYAGTGSWLSWRIGRPLFELNSERYAREADLRFALVRLNEHIVEKSPPKSGERLCRCRL
jgi:putative ATP-binding cassette transporter